MKAKIIRVTGKAVWNGGSELEADIAIKYARYGVVWSAGSDKFDNASGKV